MLSRLLTVPLLLAGIAGSASAQIPDVAMPSPEEMRGMMDFARQAMNPAAAVLAHRAELALTPAQVSALDSISAPMNRILEEMMLSQGSPGMTAVARAMMDPSQEIDEDAIRAAYREQADMQAEMMIRRVRIERQVARILTPEQNEKRQSLQMNAAFDMMRAMGGAATAPRP